MVLYILDFLLVHYSWYSRVLNICICHNNYHRAISLKKLCKEYNKKVITIIIGFNIKLLLTLVEDYKHKLMAIPIIIMFIM